MRFDLVDQVLERTDSSITTLKQVTMAEEYLQDHFATFPVLPGVFMLESMVQAARRFIEGGDAAAGREPARYVLGNVRALKYGSFVKPGCSIRVQVSLSGQTADGFEFKGQALLMKPGATDHSADADVACSGRFTLRRLRLDAPAGE